MLKYSILNYCIRALGLFNIVQKINAEIENGIVGSVLADPEQKLKKIAFDFDISKTSAKAVLNKN